MVREAQTNSTRPSLALTACWRFQLRRPALRLGADVFCPSAGCTPRRPSMSSRSPTCCRLLYPPVAPPRNVGALLRLLPGRPAPLHALRLLRDVPVPPRLGNPRRPGEHRQVLPRLPRRPDGPPQRGPDPHLQPLPRPQRGSVRHRHPPQPPRRHGPRRARRLRLARHPQRTTSSCWTTRSTRGNGAPARNPTATAGPTRSATRSSPACWSSTPSAPPRKTRAGTRPHRAHAPRQPDRQAAPTADGPTLPGWPSPAHSGGRPMAEPILPLRSPSLGTADAKLSPFAPLHCPTRIGTAAGAPRPGWPVPLEAAPPAPGSDPSRAWPGPARSTAGRRAARPDPTRRRPRRTDVPWTRRRCDAAE